MMGGPSLVLLVVGTGAETGTPVVGLVSAVAFGISQ
jgi:hypothetical protein